MFEFSTLPGIQCLWTWLGQVTPRFSHLLKKFSISFTYECNKTEIIEVAVDMTLVDNKNIFVSHRSCLDTLKIHFF